MPSLGPGSVLSGRYLLRRELGSGSFGRVFLADDRELLRPVAVKVLRSDLDDRDAIGRFLREARATARLKHPNIVQVFDHGRTPDGEDYIVYEYVEGTTAGKASRTGPPPEPHRVAGWGRAIADALASAHRAGILHRDVKPENILLRPDLSPVLADFGIAHLAADPSVRTATGMVLATPMYLAPEVLLGEAQSPASDQYALAATLYELLFGVPIHPDPAPAAIQARLAQGRAPEVPPPGARMRSPGLERILARALNRDPRVRHADLAAFAEELAACATPSAPWSPGAAAAHSARGGAAAGPPTAATLVEGPVPAAGPGAPPATRWQGALLAVAALALLAGAAFRPTGPAMPELPVGPATPGAPAPAAEAWVELERDFKVLVAGHARDPGGELIWVLPFDRRKELMTRLDLIGDPRLPVRLVRFLSLLGTWIREAGGGPVPPEARARLPAMISGYLASELPALAGIEDELSRASLRGTLLDGGHRGVAAGIDLQGWRSRWDEIRGAIEALAAGLPPRSPELELEVAVLGGLLRTLVGTKGHREALARLATAARGPVGWDWRGTAVEVSERLVERLVRDRAPPCDLAGILVEGATRDFALGLPADPSRLRNEAMRALRLVGVLGTTCREDMAGWAEDLGPVVAAFEAIARTDPGWIRAELNGLIRYRPAVDMGTRIPLAFPKAVTDQLEALLTRSGV